VYLRLRSLILSSKLRRVHCGREEADLIKERVVSVKRRDSLEYRLEECVLCAAPEDRQFRGKYYTFANGERPNASGFLRQL
jgi:hypothetical protein